MEEQIRGGGLKPLCVVTLNASGFTDWVKAYEGKVSDENKDFFNKFRDTYKNVVLEAEEQTLKKTVTKLHPDVCLLQECMDHDDETKLIPEGYEFAREKRNNGQKEECAIAWNPKRMEFASSKRIVKGNTDFFIVNLRDYETGVLYAFMTSHVGFTNLGDSSKGDWSSQVNDITEAINDLDEKKLPSVFGGDFNVGPQIEAKSSMGEKCKIHATLQSQLGYQTQLHNDPELTRSYVGGGNNTDLDHIYGKDVVFTDLVEVARLPWDLREWGSLNINLLLENVRAAESWKKTPEYIHDLIIKQLSSTYGSDHLPVVTSLGARMDIKTTQTTGKSFDRSRAAELIDKLLEDSSERTTKDHIKKKRDESQYRLRKFLEQEGILTKPWPYKKSGVLKNFREDAEMESKIRYLIYELNNELNDEYRIIRGKISSFLESNKIIKTEPEQLDTWESFVDDSLKILNGCFTEPPSVKKNRK